ncbi:MAG: hypothetical protein H6733_15850 [Alphaproteobacteria bacterium]|nr:hypothetical protein [Alphaproteobacteria bacterium]
MSDAATPVPAHLGAEFLLWLWYSSDTGAGRFDLPSPVGRVELYVDDRLAFRQPSDTKATAVLTGEDPAHTLEARAALAGGKVLQDLRFVFRRDDREYTATLRGASLDCIGLKLPQALSENPDEVVNDRMFLYEEFAMVVGGLFDRFATLRTGSAWSKDVVPAVRAWLEAQGD